MPHTHNYSKSIVPVASFICALESRICYYGSKVYLNISFSSERLMSGLRKGSDAVLSSFLWLLTFNYLNCQTMKNNENLYNLKYMIFQRLERPQCCPEAYYSAMLECWSHEPNNRPKFRDLVTKLRAIRPEQVCYCHYIYLRIVHCSLSPAFYYYSSAFLCPHQAVFQRSI